jgi:hypothetical protein
VNSGGVARRPARNASISDGQTADPAQKKDALRAAGEQRHLYSLIH